MNLRRHREPAAVERLARALDAGEVVTSDETVNGALGAARALAPALYPRESHRSALKAKMLREHAQASTEHAAQVVDSGSPDGRRWDGHSDSVHAVDVVSAELGRVTIADLEPIGAERAREVTQRLCDLAAALPPRTGR